MPYFQCSSCKKVFEWEYVNVKKCPNCNKKCNFKEITNYTPDHGGPGNIDPRLLEK